MNRKVIIDTDPGLDDAVAILFALASGRFDVIGLTTVAGNIGLDRTTANAGGLLSVMGRSDIPVISGAATALMRNNIDAIVVHGDDGLRGVQLPAPASPHQTDAVSWLAKTLVAEPSGSIDVLALGPVTNIARLIDEHPEAAGRIGHLIVMGGAILEPGNAGPASEFNFASDPEATALVLHSDIRTTIVPLDVTRRVRADRAYVEALRGNIAGDTAASLLTAYLLDDKTSRPLHDPCVMLLALAPELFGIELYRLSVNLSDDSDAGGLTISVSGSPVSVAMQVDVPGVLKLLASGFR
ncbi:nucleoside hydrolase [Devosia psychrophila]|uniref:Nucleoside hydrolase n=1 Tax=Devosia psychrophila TaxID=728005 RepID=A0A0F5PRM8_9HYPH|nr:nucleoside hydrolase [Devosia psychrophila]KKC31255.1 nucleoside hydrolase [Devosia psychrophila]SFC64581.1 pyrimidine-specific ribonucleoside hydrolase [Devosia psychrophila]